MIPTVSFLRVDNLKRGKSIIYDGKTIKTRRYNKNLYKTEAPSPRSGNDYLSIRNSYTTSRDLYPLIVYTYKGGSNFLFQTGHAQ